MASSGRRLYRTTSEKKEASPAGLGGENSRNALEASNALNYIALFKLPPVLSRGIPGKSLRVFPGSFRNLSSGKSQPYSGCGLKSEMSASTETKATKPHPTKLKKRPPAPSPFWVTLVLFLLDEVSGLSGPISLWKAPKTSFKVNYVCMIWFYPPPPPRPPVKLQPCCSLFSLREQSTPAIDSRAQFLHKRLH